MRRELKYTSHGQCAMSEKCTEKLIKTNTFRSVITDLGCTSPHKSQTIFSDKKWLIVRMVYFNGQSRKFNWNSSVFKETNFYWGHFTPHLSSNITSSSCCNGNLALAAAHTKYREGHERYMFMQRKLPQNAIYCF